MKKPNQLLSLVLLASLNLALVGQACADDVPLAPELASSETSQQLVTAKHSMVVTNNPWASKAAQQILSAGGTATDAAIAAAFVLGLTEPQSSGIGGGGYALTYTDKKLQAFDGREVAPHSANPQWFLDEQGKPLDFNGAMLSPKSVGVPSEVALLQAMHKQNGKLAWEKLLTPAIKLAKDGFPMSPRLYGLLVSDQDILKNNPQIRAVYFDKDGQVLPVGSLVVNTEYAKTLKTIADDPSEFYDGKIAKAIITTINQAAGSKLYSKKDLADYSVIIKKSNEVVCSKYRNDYTICSIPPSSSGGIAVQELLNIYASNYNGKDANDPQWAYNFLEASKLAFADRNQYLADPAFVKQPVEGLLKPKYLASRAKLVAQTNAQATPVSAGKPDGIDSKYAPDESPKAHGTTSISIVDKHGNAVSMTVTVEHQFGSHLFTNGFFLNNELTDFSFAPTSASGKPIANRVEAGKRPRSSIAPTMVFNHKNQLQMITGSPGGSQIICYVAKNIIHVLDFGQDAQAAVSAGNLCSANSMPQLESGTEVSNFTTQLSNIGESSVQTDMVSGETNIVRTANGWSGAADPRREGVAIGN